MPDACHDNLCFDACMMPAVPVSVTVSAITASDVFMYNLQLNKPQAPVITLLLHMLDACYASLWCLHKQAALRQTKSQSRCKSTV